MEENKNNEERQIVTSLGMPVDNKTSGDKRNRKFSVPQNSGENNFQSAKKIDYGNDTNAATQTQLNKGTAKKALDKGILNLKNINEEDNAKYKIPVTEPKSRVQNAIDKDKYASQEILKARSQNPDLTPFGARNVYNAASKDYNEKYEREREEALRNKKALEDSISNVNIPSYMGGEGIKTENETEELSPFREKNKEIEKRYREALAKDDPYGKFSQATKRKYYKQAESEVENELLEKDRQESASKIIGENDKYFAENKELVDQFLNNPNSLSEEDRNAVQSQLDIQSGIKALQEQGLPINETSIDEYRKGISEERQTKLQEEQNQSFMNSMVDRYRQMSQSNDPEIKEFGERNLKELKWENEFKAEASKFGIDENHPSFKQLKQRFINEQRQLYEAEKRADKRKQQEVEMKRQNRKKAFATVSAIASPWVKFLGLLLVAGIL
mgnify:CR=1 FL=1